MAGKNVLWPRSIPSTKADIRRSRLPIQKKNHSIRATFHTAWAIWDDETLLGVGALKRLSADHGEVKSMHTAASVRRKGAGSAMLRHIIEAARACGMSRLSLETGSWDYFRPARAFYARHGFVACMAFAEYVPDPNSVFMSLELKS
jgi:putative acetyltransferase